MPTVDAWRKCLKLLEIDRLGRIAKSKQGKKKRILDKQKTCENNFNITGCLPHHQP